MASINDWITSIGLYRNRNLFFRNICRLRETILAPKGKKGRSLRISKQERLLSIYRRIFFYSISALPEPQEAPKIFLEKTNRHCFYADFILRTFKNARFIHIIRDGRAVVDSCNRGLNSWWTTAPKTIDYAALTWSRYVLAGKKIKEIVENKEQYFEIKYEDLRHCTTHHLSRIFQWLDLPFDKSLIEKIVWENSKTYIENSLSKPFPSIPVSKQKSTIPPIHNETYPEGFLGLASYKISSLNLNKHQRLRIEFLVGDLLSELGYPDVKHLFPIWQLLDACGVFLFHNRALAKKIVNFFKIYPSNSQQAWNLRSRLRKH